MIWRFGSKRRFCKEALQRSTTPRRLSAARYREEEGVYAMRDSTSHLDQRVRLSRLGSWLSAGSAVEAEIPLDDYLLYKSRDYEAHYRKSRYPLPDFLEIVDGNLERIPNADYESSWEQI